MEEEDKNEDMDEAEVEAKEGGMALASACHQAYCWTHGNFSHSSTKCEAKATGHIDPTTGSNIQEGNTHSYHWL